MTIDARPPLVDGGDGAVLLRVRELAKAFGVTQALRSCSLDVRAGEVHAVVGENGSGKSTLVKILAGVHRPDAGSLEIAGDARASLRSPRRAIQAGIATVFQENLVAEPRSLLENVWLGADSLLRAPITRAEKVRRASEALADLLGEVPPLEQPVEELSISGRQACCIARALVREPRVLILDEATSALDVATRDRLFAITARLAASGNSVIFISHRMDEIEEIGDRITVLRSGTSVATLSRETASAAELVRLMTGSDHLSGAVASAAAARVPGTTVLRAHELRLRRDARPFDFDLHRGEIVGVAGLEGQGQDLFLHALRGAGSLGGRLHCAFGGEETAIRSPRDAARRGIAYVPRERRADALFETLSVRENFALPTVTADAHRGLVSRRRTDARLRAYIDRLRIVLGRSGDAITTLSGGNQQKVLMARWLAAEPRILLLNDPTRGVDLGAKRDIYALLASLARQGVAIVMVSTELDEHVELMDRVLVFREQSLFAELTRVQLSRETLVASFFGKGAAGDA